MPDRNAISIVDLLPDDDVRVEQTSALLVDAFRGTTDSWTDIGAARDEVRESFEAGRISRIALDADGAVIGWVGGIPAYEGHAWELHPLAVRPDWRRRGVGSALVADLEARVRERGGTTVYLGTDDEDGRTSLSNTNLYPNVWEHIARIESSSSHPYAFYLARGYVITGVIPDANGPGKPDILMAKRVAR